MTKGNQLVDRGEVKCSLQCDQCKYQVMSGDTIRAEMKMRLHYKISHKQIVKVIKHMVGTEMKIWKL